MSRSQSERRTAALVSGSESQLSKIQAIMPPELRRYEGEDADKYLDRMLPYYMELLVGKAMVEGDSQAISALGAFHMKKQEASIKMMAIQSAGKRGLLLQGPAKSIGEAMGMSGGAFGNLMAGNVRPSDLVDEQ